MHIIKTIFFFFSLCFLGSLNAQNTIIPKPLVYKNTTDSFDFSKGFLFKIIRGDEGTIAIKNFFITEINKLSINENSLSKSIISVNLLKESKIKNEAYELNITKQNIEIKASSDAGLYYGLQSVLQLINTAQKTKKIAGAEIIDTPLLSYRAMHLDVSRHFFGVDVIKHYLDVMGKLKLNYFHWHLTDDQGWRIEIRKYPLLTEIGACRQEKDSSMYCGYYTQEQIKDIVKYAQERFITIIPEIDFPAHTSAMIASYPYLGCYDKPIKVPNTFGIKQDILCPSDSTILFLKEVLNEICTLFPAPYIHIGGDEVDTKQWKESIKAKQICADRNISPHKIQAYFIEQMETHLKSKGKTAIVWGDAVNITNSKDVVVMSWRGINAAQTAIKNGKKAILTPRTFCYFDYHQYWDEEKKAIYMSYLPLEKVYNFNPFDKIKDTQQQQHILGAQACVWTEFIKNTTELQHQIFPRIIAFSESVWTPKKNKKSYDFQDRLKKQQKYLEK